NVPYASAVGSIMYAVRCTRPDGAFAQNITSRCQQNPGDIHWTTVKNILKYLRNTKDVFLVYGEAKYITAFDASKEAVWVRKFISGLSVVSIIEEPISMYCDNTRAIAIAKESGITKGLTIVGFGLRFVYLIFGGTVAGYNRISVKTLIHLIDFDTRFREGFGIRSS
nr:hypothetical protein [Tanacetum cinerariifolium]